MESARGGQGVDAASAPPTTDPDGDSQDSAAPATSNGWRHLFSEVGDLVAVRDARGCGQNFYYDHAGRLVAEDYVECGESRGAHTADRLAAGTFADIDRWSERVLHADSLAAVFADPD